MEKSFGEVLASLRRSKGLNQRDLINPKLNLSASYLAKIEANVRGANHGRVNLTRPQLWHFVKRIRLDARGCHTLFDAAGHDTNRSLAEELELQTHFEFSEVWEFTYTVGDYNPPRFEAIVENLRKGIRYAYFMFQNSGFWLLHKRLLSEGFKDAELDQLLEGHTLPEELFQQNFTILNPGQLGNKI